MSEISQHLKMHSKLDVPSSNKIIHTIVSTSARIGPILGEGNGVWRNFITAPVPASKWKAGSMLRINGVISWGVGTAENKGVRLQVAGITLAQFFPNTAERSLTFLVYVIVNANKTGFIVTHQTPAVGTPYQYLTTNVINLAADLSIEQDIILDAFCFNSDTHTLESLTAEIFPYGGEYFGAETNVACWGDSLTFGTGASISGMLPSSTDYPAYFMNNSPDIGRAVHNGGEGGDTSDQIKARMLADVEKKHWVTILWAGRNDLDGGSDGITVAAILANIADMVASLSHTRFLVLSVINKGGTDITEQQGTSVYNQIIELNTALLALYPDNYYDIRTQLVAVSTGALGVDCIGTSHMHTDNLHLNDTGYWQVRLRSSNHIAAAGW